MDTDFVRQLMSPRHFLGPQRIDFYQLLLFTAGQGIHTVDLVRYPVSRGTLIMVRPGQVQEWDSVNWPSAKMLLVDPSFLLPQSPEYPEAALTATSSPWPVRLSLTVQEFFSVEDAIDEIREEMEQSDSSPLSVRLLVHLYYALLIRLERMSEQHPSRDEAEGPANIHRRFRLEVDRHFKTSRSVGDYAAMLGYSEKSLYRAIVASAGRTPKQVIDERVALEAQRLLVHTRWSLKRIAAELGFGDPSNFVKFFRRTVREAPSEYRRQQLGPRRSGAPAPRRGR
jgi:AraC-like DNA-binding protein